MGVGRVGMGCFGVDLIDWCEILSRSKGKYVDRERGNDKELM